MGRLHLEIEMPWGLAVVPFGSCDRQEMTMLGLFLLALMGALLGMAALSRIR